MTGSGQGNIYFIRVRDSETAVLVPECHYWVEGDNSRERASEDSNFYGPVSPFKKVGTIFYFSCRLGVRRASARTGDSYPVASTKIAES